eukprot:CAMPEP_0114449770 /NCGR_PEP_ID=MMETSP0104-20121206/110_1 /TAXON_ID=37642 ORGANISM="Paraphysomonas imperforata, Strain PA2" /NCGR_SAMPLE_ID=MMETSP0104 /ASSEMBLY_ACC=CAM_ASM_000202 /LENGTH=216 /DNA_ID=CAMNT_0001621879 /DNA_START=21 /DNA_END=672 /DNA_ORIENTATION=+
MSATGASGSVDETNKKVLKRDVSLLREFDSSESPDLLVLYYHLKDAQFDCFNAAEYQMQLKQYYDGGIAVVLVAPRKINDHSYLLVCLQNSRPEHNVLCQLAFQCQRQFCGVSLLLKKRCFVCHKPTMMDARGVSARASARGSVNHRVGRVTRSSVSASSHPMSLLRKSALRLSYSTTASLRAHWLISGAHRATGRCCAVVPRDIMVTCRALAWYQ